MSFSSAAPLVEHQVIYLRSGIVFQVGVSAEARVRELSRVELPGANGHPYQYGGLTCGRNGKIILGRVRFDLELPIPKALSSIVEFDIKSRSLDVIFGEVTEILGAPKLSPSGQTIAMLFHKYDEPTAVGFLDVSTKSIWKVEKIGVSSPSSWAQDSSAVLVSFDPSRGNREISRLDLHSRKFISVGVGQGALYSPEEKHIASISSDQRTVSVQERSSATARDAKMFSKYLVAWLDPTTIVAVTGTLYDDRLAYISLNGMRTREIRLPGEGEIRGACINR